MDLQEMQDKHFSLMKKLFSLGKTIFISLIGYIFLSFVFLSVYDNLGFERTLIILLIGVFYIKIKRNEKG